ncbi:uncharacterized protein JCM15063_004879 [Sporobolomyces koalae]|uniref:uncharacterized protein n=1 Tax=Sporobolomyces koalae TaxID=500713 RepID=UPI003177B5D1
MDSGSDIVYDSEPERVSLERRERPARFDSPGSVRNHLRRTSDERPELSSAASQTRQSREVLVLDSASESGTPPPPTTTRSKYFSSTDSPPKRRRRTVSPPPAPPDWSPSRSPFSCTSVSSSTAASQLNPIASTSALDLLQFSPVVSTSGDRPSDSVRKSSRDRSARTLQASGSTSSIEILEAAHDLLEGKHARTDHDELECPDLLLERDVEAISKRRTKGKGKAFQDEPIEPTASGIRRKPKPWEKAEAKVGTMRKRRSTSTAKRRKGGDDVSRRDSIGSNDDDKVEIISARPEDSMSTAFQPSPSSRKHTPLPSTALFTKRATAPAISATSSSRTLFDAPVPIVLPSEDRIKCLSHCPLCAFAATLAASTDAELDPFLSWGNKPLATRMNHLRTCSRQHDYSATTVAHLVNQQILLLAAQVEQDRLERDLGKSLFDRAIGKGEGITGREVTVIGIDESLGMSEHDLKSVQEDIDEQRKKVKKGGIEDKLVRIAKEIRYELKAARESNESEMREREEEEEKEGLPRPTGRLRPETRHDRDQVAKRAKALLELATGTGLTQAPVSSDFSGLHRDPIHDNDEADEEYELDLPATQPFEDSALAKRFEQDGTVHIVQPLSIAAPGPHRSTSPAFEAECALTSDEERDELVRKKSLWQANVGQDERSLERNVDSQFPLLGSSPPTPTFVRHLSYSPRRATDVVNSTAALSSLTISSPISSSPSSSIASLSRPSITSRIASPRSSREYATVATTPARRRRKIPDQQNKATESRDSARAKRPARESLEGEPDVWQEEADDVMVSLQEGAVMAGGYEGGRAEESSEEEPLMRIVERSSPTKSLLQIATSARRSTSNVSRQPRTASVSPALSKTRTKSKPKPKSKSKSNRDPPLMPTYSSLPLLTLQKEVGKYGFRASKEKSVLVQQLQDVWRAVNKDKIEAWQEQQQEELVSSDQNAEARSEEVVVGTRKNRKKNDGQSNNRENIQPKPTKGRRKRRTRAEIDADNASAGDDAEQEAGETRTVGERLRELIVNDESLYCRILRYEPIHIDEFILLAANNNVKVARTLLIRCLDEQSITFYQEDPTNGQRKRHR